MSRYINQQTGLDITTMGATPFWCAASYGDWGDAHPDEWGADPWINTYGRTTPLMVAAGVDFVEGQDKYGRRLFAFDTTMLQSRANGPRCGLLPRSRPDINAANNKGQTALHGAVYFGGRCCRSVHGRARRQA